MKKNELKKHRGAYQLNKRTKYLTQMQKIHTRKEEKYKHEANTKVNKACIRKAERHKYATRIKES